MSRLVFAFLICVAGISVQAQEGPPPAPLLQGSVQGDMYVSPTGAFKIKIPVDRALGGTIVDSDNAVTFQDPFSMYVTVVAFAMDASQKWQMDIASTREEYLSGFFRDHVLPDFRRSFPDVQVETNGRFLTGLYNGSLIIYMLVPGGSMFARAADQVAIDPKPQVAKRGNMLFVHNGYIFVISTELAERVTEGSAYHQTSEEEDVILRDRLVDVVSKIQFPAPPHPAAATP